MSNVYGYIRVSTTKQGQQGVSLQEQRSAIERYAARNGLTIISWFEEQETAAKRGRPVFGQMLRHLKAGKALGVIIHKIDRGARNLRDWADLGELIDRGITVHFANESLDLHTRGGRLSADIQAVVAADYVRNLRDETRKGFYGRIKQGLFPLPAPLGYLDKGKGKPKELDPAKAPLVKKAFELYGTGRFTLHTLAAEMHRLGLRNKRGGKVSITGFSTILNNPFYIGLIRLKRTDETFPGVHEPLISKSLFDRIQNILTGKWNARTQKHDFVFRRLLTCKSCGYSLIGEVQKGHRYYRCHTKGCPVTNVREEQVQEEISRALAPLQLAPHEATYFRNRMVPMKEEWERDREAQIQSLELAKQRLQERMNRLTDAYVDVSLDKETFENRKAVLLMDRQAVEERLRDLRNGTFSIPAVMEEFLEQARSAYLTLKNGFPEEKQNMLKSVTSNRVVSGKNVEIQLKNPFEKLANRVKFSNGAPCRVRPRTNHDGLEALLDELVVHFKREESGRKKGEAAG